tara:strand:- start:480 stop:821 length:342 start_codon:yes stop_codon:yes gene_type:complete
MPCQILVSNQSGLPKAEIITVVNGDHTWTKNESMQAFIADGGSFDDWVRVFSIVIVTDKTNEELLYLQDSNSTGERRWYFIEPAQSTSEWQDLYLTGQTSGNWLKVKSFIGER